MYEVFGEDDDILTATNSAMQKSASYKEAQADLTGLSDEEFHDHYKATKKQYRVLIASIKQLRITKDAIDSMVALNVDPEISNNTQLLVEDYEQLLEQMHMASWWEKEC